jgi:hypothetical protein
LGAEEQGDIMNSKQFKLDWLRVVKSLFLIGEGENMKRSLASTSLLLFIISLAMLWILTLFESFLSGMTTALERSLTAPVAVLRAVIGVVAG